MNVTLDMTRSAELYYTHTPMGIVAVRGVVRRTEVNYETVYGRG